MSEMKQFAEAFSDFQFNCPAINKDSEVEVKTKSGGSYKFCYASFGNIIQTIKEPMHNAKLSYKFLTQDNKFVCRIRHISGEFEDTALELPKFKESMQENGSNLTYLMRYALKLALGLDTDTDDDSNTGEGNEVKLTQKTQPREAVANTDKFIKENGKNIGNYSVKVGKFKGKKLSEIDAIQLQQYIVWLHNSAKEQNKPLTGDALELAKIGEAYLTPEMNTSEPID